MPKKIKPPIAKPAPPRYRLYGEYHCENCTHSVGKANDVKDPLMIFCGKHRCKVIDFYVCDDWE